MDHGDFGFLAHFVKLTDPRKDRDKNHQLLDMVALALCSTIGGTNIWADIERFARGHQDWFDSFWPCRRAFLRTIRLAV